MQNVLTPHCFHYRKLTFKTQLPSSYHALFLNKAPGVTKNSHNHLNCRESELHNIVFAICDPWAVKTSAQQ